MLTFYRRHLDKCAHRSSKFLKCKCPLWVMGTLDGRFIRRSLGTRNLEHAGDIIRDMEAGKRKLHEISVKDALGRYIKDAEARALKSASLKKYRNVKAELEAKFGPLPLRTISVDDIRKLRESWKLSGNTTGKRLEHIRSFFTFCLDAGWIEKNPAKGVKAPQVRHTPTLPFSKEEWENIQSAVEIYPEAHPQSPAIVQKKIKALVLLMRYSGLRISDAVSLKRDRVDSDGRLFLYTQKTGKPVHIKLPTHVVQALDGSFDGELFWNFRGTLKSRLTEWQERLKKIAVIAGIEGRGFAHRLRDSFSVDLLNHGTPVEMVAILLGNTVTIVQKHYAPWMHERQQALDRYVEAIW